MKIYVYRNVHAWKWGLSPVKYQASTAEYPHGVSEYGTTAGSAVRRLRRKLARQRKREAQANYPKYGQLLIDTIE